MFYLLNEVNFIKYLNYFYKLNLKSPSSINLVKEDKRGIKWDGFASLARNCKQIIIQVPLVSLLNKKKFINLIKLFLQILKSHSLTRIDY